MDDETIKQKEEVELNKFSYPQWIRDANNRTRGKNLRKELQGKLI